MSEKRPSFSSSVMTNSPRFSQKIILHTGQRRSSAAPFHARLSYVTSFGGKVDFNIVKDKTTIGRRDDNDIVLTCAKISKYHAVVEQVDG
jgi:adenylate cyclase